MGASITERIAGKIIITAELINTSPLLIGKGEGEASDHDIMLAGDQPYIPSSSFTGCLASLFKHTVDTAALSPEEELFRQVTWGTNKEEERVSGDNGIVFQSHLLIDDLEPLDDQISAMVVRDGVSINHGTGIAEKGKKYDYQVLEPGTVCRFRAEITLREGMHTTTGLVFFRKLVRFIHEAPGNPLFSTGAHATTGFGKLEWKAGSFKAFHFNFSGDNASAAAEQWFEYCRTGSLQEPNFLPGESGFNPSVNDLFTIEALFRLKTALMVASYGVEPKQPDKTHIKSNSKPVLPGKSIKGALRHRALRILNTLEVEAADKKINDMMGFADEGNNTVKPVKSRLFIQESLLDDAVETEMTQPRIRIDRFTGGAADTALFDTQPVWKKGEKGFRIVMSLQKNDEQDWEAGLLLQLLKDLWTGDLAIGGEKNIGRGVLEGLYARISWGTTYVEIRQDQGGKLQLGENPGAISKLEDFAKELAKLSKQN